MRVRVGVRMGVRVGVRVGAEVGARADEGEEERGRDIFGERNRFPIPPLRLDVTS